MYVCISYKDLFYHSIFQHRPGLVELYETFLSLVHHLCKDNRYRSFGKLVDLLLDNEADEVLVTDHPGSSSGFRVSGCLYRRIASTRND